MSNHNEISSFIWNVCDDVLRGLFRQHEYEDLIISFFVLRRLDCYLKEMVMYCKKVSELDSEEYTDSVFDWGMGSFGSEGYVLMNENYQCPKCKEMSLKFEPTGMWD